MWAISCKESKSLCGPGCGLTAHLQNITILKTGVRGGQKQTEILGGILRTWELSGHDDMLFFFQ